MGIRIASKSLELLNIHEGYFSLVVAVASRIFLFVPLQLEFCQVCNINHSVPEKKFECAAVNQFLICLCTKLLVLMESLNVLQLPLPGEAKMKLVN